jgi:membrane protein YqaA with SNARE-associated domain
MVGALSWPPANVYRRPPAAAGVMQILTDLPAYSGLFLSAFLAATILPMSSEAVLAGLIAAGTGNPAALFVVATIANTLGSVVNWLIGRGIEQFRDRPWFPVGKDRYDAACRRFARYGLWSLVFAWLPFVGDPLTVAAGALRVPLPRFVILVGLGKAARYATIVAGIGWWIS